MIYWLEDVSKCPAGHKLAKPSKYVRHNTVKDIQIPVYECPVCKKTFLKYPGAKIAVNINTSTQFLSVAERERINALKKAEEIKKQKAAWEAKQERDRIEKARLEEQKRKELEAKKAAEEERNRRLLSEYTSEELFVSDRELFLRATTILKKMYGSDAKFRPGQYEAIERTIKEKRLLVVQKTGWGKSLVYFICTKLLREKGSGVTLVISPLLALMENQLSAAQKIGLTCAALNSTTSNEKESILMGMESDTYDLVLATPESLMSKKVKQYLPSIKIGLLVIDEAHCISDWGHDFRLEYSKIYRVIEQLQPNVPVLATTATANNVVIEDLSVQMGAPNVSRGHLMRDNLSIQVLNLPGKENRYAWILDNILRLPGTGIIYCLSRNDCTWLSDFLQENGISAEPYFSGDKEQERQSQETLKRFLNDEIKVIVSTIKLGMGFDKGNVAFVIHFQCPKNVIAYYQQIGRAGRNIEFAKTFLMLGNEDYKINKGFIDKAFPTETEMARIRQYITASKGSCTVNKICADIDFPKKTVLKVLDFLEDGDFIEKEWRSSTNGTPYAVYKSTAVPFVYAKEHYEKIKAIRYHELAQMQEIANTSECLNRTVVACLDDIEDHDCGICSNCDKSSRFPTQVSAMSLKKATDFLKNLTIPIYPWKYWPRNRLYDDLTNYYPNIEGVALSKYNEGLGRLVSSGKYDANKFDDLLVRKGAQVISRVIRQNQIKYITAVPSLNTDVVPDYAKRLATACGLTYIPLLNKVNHSHQKDLQNTSHQFENAVKSFQLIPGAVAPNSVVLVDDMVDSGLTLAVCGAILGRAGCEQVFPLALADSSSGGKDDEDD